MPGLENLGSVLVFRGDRCAYLGVDLRWHFVPTRMLIMYVAWHWFARPRKLPN